MKREDIKINGFKILLSLFEKYKNEPWVLSSSEIERKKNSFFGNKRWKTYGDIDSKYKYGLQSGIALTERSEYFDDYSYNLVFIEDDGITRFDIRKISLKELKNIFWFNNHNKLVVYQEPIYRDGYPYFENYVIDVTDYEFKFLNEFLDKFSSEINKVIKSTEKELMLLNHSKTNILEEFDKDGNGIIDVIEGFDDFMSLFKKHQKIIIDLDKEYIQKFVKISNYLKTKRHNIQEVFTSIKKTKNKSELENQVGILKNQIHSYELLLFHSLNMITSVVEEDLIVFYEIYESFDKLNMFTSNWENEVSQKLSNIGEGLNDLMFSIDSMERNIVKGLNELTYVTQEGFLDLERSVTKELKSIDSSIKFNNLLTGISAYQLYNINKQTKGLNK